MAKQMVAALKPGSVVSSHFVVARKQLFPYRDNSKGYFLSLTLADRSGEIEAKVWQEAERIYEELELEQIVAVEGRVDDYRGARQLIVRNIRPVVEEAGLDLNDFLPTTTADVAELKERLKNLILSVQEPHLAALLVDWFRDNNFLKAYVTAPAAKRIHHAYLGGLLEHSLEVVRFAECAAALYPAASRDLVVAGGLLHDIGKINEYRCQRVISLTDEGKLMGHTILGYAMLKERLARYEGFPAELAMHLGHIILSHHGELEYGAPVLPQTLEAVILHQADLASARIKQCLQLIEQGAESPESAWSAYEKTLNRNLYLGFMPQTEVG